MAKIDEVMELVQAQGVDIRTHALEVQKLRLSLEGDESKGIKPPFERLFEMVAALPCHAQAERIAALETARAINGAIKIERARWLGILRKFIVPGGVGAGIIALIEAIR